MQDKYSATWVSHSSISDYLNCPRSYFLKNMYKEPKTGRKIQIISPPLALGQVVHQVLESLSILPLSRRFTTSPLLAQFNQAWQSVSGIKGGFFSLAEENRYKSRGEEMIKRVETHPGPLKNLAVKINDNLPHFYLSPSDNIILCGKIDWLEYLPDTDSVHIIDFKTSTNEEDPRSLQLPIYYLLVKNCQNRPVSQVSYWYLAKSDKPSRQKLPNYQKSFDKILKIAKKIKLARQLNTFKCPQGSRGCFACRPLESVLAGKAQFVGADDLNRSLYVLPPSSSASSPSSTVL